MEKKETSRRVDRSTIKYKIFKALTERNRKKS